MASHPPLAPFDAVIVAGGQGLRAGQTVPKQFANWRGAPVLSHSVKAFAKAGAQAIAVVVPDVTDKLAIGICAPYPHAILVKGGHTRQESVRFGLEALAASAAGKVVMIHDAARPDIPRDVLERLMMALDHTSGAIPVLPVVDSLAIADDNLMAGQAPRDQLRRIQTPQAFRFADILAAHRAWQGPLNAGDDAQVAARFGLQVTLVEGDETLKKLTYAEDFIDRNFVMNTPQYRIGQGYDVHRLAKGEECWLGGVLIPHSHGLSGHSDADVALHALTDAVLGAIASGDIGTHFPPSDPKWRGASSDQFLRHACALAADKGYAIGNIDLTIICEAPKIGPHRGAITANIAHICGIDVGQVSVKATTTERLGFTGRSEGIAAQAVAMLFTA